MPLDQWFPVRIEFNNPTYTYDYYVNDILQASDRPAYFGGYEESFLEWHLIGNDLFEVPEGAYMMIDRVHWSHTPVPEPNILILSGLGLLALLRRKTTS